jgi:hypothetical protein
MYIRVDVEDPNRWTANFCFFGCGWVVGAVAATTTATNHST